MKKKLILGGALILMIALFAMAAMRDPEYVPDVELFRDVKPFAKSVQLEGSVGFVQRHYSLHMHYDDVVKSLEKELSPLGWTHTDTYWKSTFQRRGPMSDTILVNRGRLVTGVRQPIGNRGKLSGSNETLAKLTGTEMPESRGWVTVLSLRQIAPLDRFLLKVRKMVNKRPLQLTRYEIVTPMPMPGSIRTPIDVHRGTKDRESHIENMVNYTAATN